jgi:hypothetical protein
LNIAFTYTDRLINGVTNSPFSSNGELFLFHNILPKLQAYGLAENEKVAGVAYRRSFLNKKGQELFAAIEKKMLLARPKKTEGELKLDNGKNVRNIEKEKNEARATGITQQQKKGRPRTKKAE